MRCITLNELRLISGGNSVEQHDFSDTFLAGMKGEDITPYLTNTALIGMAIGGIFIGAWVGLFTHSVIYGIAGSVGGAALGAGSGYLGTIREYHKGENYVAAMQILNP